MVKKARNNSETAFIHVIRDDDEHSLYEENNVKKHWTNYVESVFACEDTVADDNVTATEYMIDDEIESEITMDEIIKALKRMKVGKAAGYDRVSSKVLRGDEDIKASMLHQLFSKCWKSHSTVPNDWFKAVIAPLYKEKDDREVIVFIPFLKGCRARGVTPPPFPTLSFHLSLKGLDLLFTLSQQGSEAADDT
ncbi:hypothetical protein EVAR_61521_1 [Eumeta japonica]|uniref:Uncharacterized protein n=1 Tax=Eumeta variegata TaxID=151549 RepID=A0A4C1YVB5_EUMVA|nr:hypothetical protein EVAR_61521_1 [Eumeta japonica]